MVLNSLHFDATTVSALNRLKHGAVRRKGAAASAAPARKAEAALDQAIHAARALLQAALAYARCHPTVEAVDGILGALKREEQLGVYFSDDEDDAWALIEEILQGLCHEAECRFREFPSSERYGDWWVCRKHLDVVGLDEPEAVEAPPRGRALKIHTVVPGDTLSKLARHYYGKPCLWDYIYEANRIHFHPDRIMPGMKLILPGS